MVVAALHPNPLRVFAYVSPAATDAWGYAGVVNSAQVIPTPTADAATLLRDLFEADGVASAQPVTRTREVFEDAIDQFTGFLIITEVAVVVLAVLIAFNSTRITVEERRREHATMIAFGTPVRSVLATIVKEGVLVGLLATALGILAGYGTLSWFIAELFSDTLPELGIAPVLSFATLAWAVGIGVLAVAVAPTLMVRSLQRMSLPSTLRVME